MLRKKLRTRPALKLIFEAFHSEKPLLAIDFNFMCVQFYVFCGLMYRRVSISVQLLRNRRNISLKLAFQCKKHFITRLYEYDFVSKQKNTNAEFNTKVDRN